MVNKKKKLLSKNIKKKEEISIRNWYETVVRVSLDAAGKKLVWQIVYRRYLQLR